MFSLPISPLLHWLLISGLVAMPHPPPGLASRQLLLLFEVTDSITRSRLKLPGFCRGGNLFVS
jgi:hypothetical protein